MPDVRQAAEKVVRDGLAATYNGALSVSDDYQINSPHNIILHFKKSGAGACVVTFTTQNTKDGQAVADRTVTIPATTGDKFIGPFPEEIYADTIGDLRYQLSEVTGLTVAVLRIPINK